MERAIDLFYKKQYNASKKEFEKLKMKKFSPLVWAVENNILLCSVMVSITIIITGSKVTISLVYT